MYKLCETKVRQPVLTEIPYWAFPSQLSTPQRGQGNRESAAGYPQQPRGVGMGGEGLALQSLLTLHWSPDQNLLQASLQGS